MRVTIIHKSREVASFNRVRLTGHAAEHRCVGRTKTQRLQDTRNMRIQAKISGMPERHSDAAGTPPAGGRDGGVCLDAPCEPVARGSVIDLMETSCGMRPRIIHGDIRDRLRTSGCGPRYVLGMPLTRQLRSGCERGHHLNPIAHRVRRTHRGKQKLARGANVGGCQVETFRYRRR